MKPLAFKVSPGTGKSGRSTTALTVLSSRSNTVRSSASTRSAVQSIPPIKFAGSRFVKMVAVSITALSGTKSRTSGSVNTVKKNLSH